MKQCSTAKQLHPSLH